MAIPSHVQDALGRLNGGYNNGDYNASSNPLGFSNGGHRINLYALTADVTLVGEWLYAQVEPVVDISAAIQAVAAITEEVETVSAIDDKIVTLAGIAAQLTTLAGIAASITAVAGIAGNVTTVAGIAAHVTTVAGIHGNVSTVAARDTAIATVAARDAAIVTVAARDADIGTVADVAAAVASVAAIDDNVSTVAAISASVSTVAARDVDIGTVADRDADIGTVAARDGDIGTVADRASDIGTVAGIGTQVSALAAIDTDVTTVAGLAAAVGTVAARDVEIGVVAGLDAEIAVVAARDADIGLVAGIQGSVAAVAAIDEQVETVAGIASAVISTATNEESIVAVAGSIADVASVAANMGGVLAAEGFAMAAQAAARPYAFDDVTVDADPGAGAYRMNNATPSSVTMLYVSTSDTVGADQAAFIEAMDDSTTTDDRGQITLTNAADRSNQIAFRVTGAVTAATGYRRIPVAYIGHSGAMVDGESYALAFVRSGNKGLDGLGAGDVVGPAGATDQHVAIMDGSSGKAIADGGVAISAISAALTKVGHLAVTQPVDLDAIEARVNALDAAVVLKGTWSAAGGAFPGGGTAQAGESWIVSTGGTVDGVAFTVNDRLIAITDNASVTTFSGNWFKADYTDAVSSINGQTGAVTIEAIINASADKAAPDDADIFLTLDSAASFALKKWTWANLKAAAKTYFDVIYGALATANLWAKTQRGVIIEVDSGTTITLDLDLGQIFRVKAPGLSHNATVQIANATSHIGAKFTLTGYQNAGGNTLSYGSGLVNIGGAAAPAIPTAASAKFRMDGDIVASGEYHFTTRGVGA